MTTATETQPTITRERHDCGRLLTRSDIDGGRCHGCWRMITASDPQSAITLSNFRVVYRAPRYEDGRVLYDGYCAILADSAEHDGAEVRVFNVPDVDEGQLAAALFACEAMNAHVKLRDTLRLLKAMDNCNYDLETMRASGLFVAVDEALATTTSK